MTDTIAPEPPPHATGDRNMNTPDSDIDDEGRCEAMTLPSWAGDLPPY
jgi:hypothetical protein